MAESTSKLDFQLYVITGANYHPGRSIVDVVEQALIGGADIVQLRDKTASKQDIRENAHKLRQLTRRYGVPLIINDHIDIALEADADGVHLGQDDLSLAEARQLLGPDRIIGISTHSIEQGLAAQAGGADYIGVGPVYPTGTKPGRAAVTTSYVQEAAAQIRIPFVAIGGITLGNVDTVIAAGANRVCAVSEIVGADDPAAVCRAFKARLNAAANHSQSPSRQGQSQGTSSPNDSQSSAAQPHDFAGTGVTVNGVAQRTTARTVWELICQHRLEDRRIVVELDGAIVVREEWSRTPIREGAAVELVHFVGGG
ncbi:thiamine phosphate synthase [Paenibacillus sp. PR3]|uniref:Thiamine-phosphate synthase n=1 Tax=Paenibacillus terricola TaxID=2763503 RepID=A0ABR8MVS1_9BACL|nr:thiamine phosphate synthase [Paenibacillus terricola]MBD3920052.1 thiamine phosphate synthase [Paenibacillus terricola]